MAEPIGCLSSLQITGLLASGFGLSSGVTTLIYDVGFSSMSSVSPFLLFMAFSVLAVSIIGAFVMKLVRNFIQVILGQLESLFNTFYDSYLHPLSNLHPQCLQS